MENTTKEYQPFNEEWEKEMNKLPKQVLIAMLSDFGKEKSILKTQFEEMKTALDHINKSAVPHLTGDELRSFVEMTWRISNSVLASLTENNEKQNEES